LSQSAAMFVNQTKGPADPDGLAGRVARWLADRADNLREATSKFPARVTRVSAKSLAVFETSCATRFGTDAFDVSWNEGVGRGAETRSFELSRDALDDEILRIATAPMLNPNGGRQSRDRRRHVGADVRVGGSSVGLMLERKRRYMCRPGP
jgi:hypothetical protein